MYSCGQVQWFHDAVPLDIITLTITTLDIAILYTYISMCVSCDTRELLLLGLVGKIRTCYTVLPV